MTGDGSPERRLPDSLTRLLAAPRSTIRPTPDDRARRGTGRREPRRPSRAATGVWVWVILFNVVGFAILAALWRSMG